MAGNIALFTPVLLLPTFQLPSSLPGSAQWTSPFPEGNNGKTHVTGVSFTTVLDDVITIHLTPPGVAPVAANRIWIDIPAVAGMLGDWHSNGNDDLIIPAAYSLWFFAGIATNVNLTMYGFNES